MHRRAFVALALLLSLSACEGSTDPIPTVTGVWSGISDGITVSVTLAQTNSSVSGSGTLSGISVLAIAVSGTFVNPNLSLTITAGGFEDVNFTGTLSGNSVTGTLNGSGFTNESITLTRD